jgi:hypothetical protein
MRIHLLSFIVFFFSPAALAQGQGEVEAPEASSREALLKAAVARDRGEISAMEPSSSPEKGVFIGYTSGAVLNCYGNDSCEEFSGTPNTAVEHIAVSKRAQSEVIWVSYRHGALYQCINGGCRKFIWDGLQLK